MSSTKLASTFLCLMLCTAAPSELLGAQVGSRAGDQKPAVESGRQRPAPEAKEGEAAGESVGRGLSERELGAVKRYLGEVRKNRDRLARIARLRELALQAGDRERLAALDALQAKELERSKKQKDSASKAISPETMAQIDARVMRSEKRGQGGERGTRQPAEQPAEGGARRPAEKPAEKPAERPAEKPAQKPAERPPVGGARGAGGGAR